MPCQHFMSYLLLCLIVAVKGFGEYCFIHDFTSVRMSQKTSVAAEQIGIT